MPITPLLAAIFGVMYIILSFGVIRFRFRNQVSLGDGGYSDLKKAIRIHGNFAEYVPFTLLLLYLLEYLSLSGSLVFGLGIALLISRVAHYIGMKNHSFFRFRQFGMIGTFLVILISSVTILWLYLPVSI